MMGDINANIRGLRGIGEKKAQAFNKLGVFSLFDLISYFPRRYEDRSRLSHIALTLDGESVCVCALVADTPRLSRIRRGLDIVRFRAVDGSGAVDISYFNQSYLKDKFHRGESYYFYGKIQVSGSHRSMTNPVFEPENSPRRVTGKIVPVYRLSAGLSAKDISGAIEQALAQCIDSIPELMPESLRERLRLAPVELAYKNIHFPADEKTLEAARQRLVFEELFVLACALGRMRGQRSRSGGIVMPLGDIEEFWRAMPFVPTGAQRRCVDEALNDMRSGAEMNRLVQGDVGSGKTLVAAALVWYAFKNGRTSAFMAPTEILAEQHFDTLTKLLSPLGLRIVRLTGSMTAAEKRKARELLANGEFDLVVGTHAILSEGVEPKRLGLVVTDEQHRFGVEQRARLVGKGENPHVLVMSATPIPRTLALIIYGELDVSIIDELPPGRQKVDTFAVDESYRARLNGFIRRQTEQGRQVFVVCPMVEENDDLPQKLKSAEEHAKELTGIFPELNVGCIHGRLKSRDKDAVMAAFVHGEIDILVSTTVIEVGVDVPNASLIVVENAERFGLSQLHQLRGRVGRGQHKSYCVLVSDSDGEDVRRRLRIMTRTNDGFRISEEDLRLRGPGDFFGSRQHGLPELHMAELGADAQLMQQAQTEAAALLASDPELAFPEHTALRERVELLFSKNAQGFN